MRLKAEEQTQLRALLKVDQAPTRKLTHARILLKADQHASGMHDKQAEQAGKNGDGEAWHHRSGADLQSFAAKGTERMIPQTALQFSARAALR